MLPPPLRNGAALSSNRIPVVADIREACVVLSPLTAGNPAPIPPKPRGENELPFPVLISPDPSPDPDPAADVADLCVHEGEIEDDDDVVRVL